MSKFINKKSAIAETPKPGIGWIQKTESERIDILNKVFVEKDIYSKFKIINANDNGEVIIQNEQIIPAKDRGILLLNLEELFKKLVDPGISLWLVPVGDKSKLRNLRGIQFKNNEK